MSHPEDSEDVRQRADWMNPVDERILEAIDQEGNLTPLALEEPFDVTSKSHASDRLSLLTRYGLVERVARGLYRITDDGEAFLEGDLDASSLEPSDG